ncbi:MAG: hypothetical protein RJA55_423 [Acidobacteriota bacterium]|jgi:hypothetical protein
MIPRHSGSVGMRRPPVAALLLLVAATTAAAQSPNDAWSPVRQLPLGQPVRVLTDAAIREVSVGPRSRKRDVWWGLTLGAAASFVAVGVTCAGETEGCNEAAPAWFYPMAGVGAAIGGLMPPRTVWRPIYVSVP